MRRCFYHTDLEQNAVFHNFAIQIALIQYSGRSKYAWALAKPLKEFPKSPIRLVCYTAVFSVITQRSSGGALRDDTKNGCVADYYSIRLAGSHFWQAPKSTV